MSILLTKGNIDDVFKVLDNHNINSALMLDTKLKALEIIKEKDVDIALLKRSENWLDYYTRFKHRTGKNTELTEEEFELLKRYFEKNIQKWWLRGEKIMNKEYWKSEDDFKEFLTLCKELGLNFRNEIEDYLKKNNVANNAQARLEFLRKQVNNKNKSVKLTKEEKDYILSLIDKNTEDISKLEGAISDDGWIYEIYDMANSIREKFKGDD